MNAAIVAGNAITAAGFTPCPHSAFEANGKAYAFSSESVHGRSESGPALEAVVTKSTGAVAITGTLP